jgi:NAD(P)-dependent dehydrogenase (short-subunit alcohol dehydrogenase family)
MTGTNSGRPGRVVIVTGGSRGIGAATARLAGARGFSVAVNYNSSPEAAGAVVDAIVAAGGRAVAIQADVSREADIVKLFDEAARLLGPVTALVNNAGITGRSSKFNELTADDIEKVLRLNVTGTFLCAREAVKRMSTALGGRGGTIVNVSSAAATLGSPGEFVHYAASKSAINALTVGLAKEVALQGIRVNAVAPGMIDTEIHLSSGDPGRVARLVPTVPMARIGSAEEVAEAILFLLSDASSYVTGEIVRVAGGR